MQNTNLFQRIFNYVCVFRVYEKSVFSKSENTPKLFYRTWKMRQKSLSVHGDFKWFYCNVVVASTKNMLQEYKRMRRRIRQEYFGVCREYADGHKTESISANFRPKQKKSDPKSPFYT
jgi:hypothetical protein